MPLQAPLDTLLQSGVASGSVAGVAAAVTDRDGLLYEAGFGERALGGVYVTQILPFVDQKALMLYLDFETAVYNNLP